MVSDDRSESLPPEERSRSRREFLKNAGLIAGGMVVGGSGGFAVSELTSDEPPSPTEDATGTPTALVGTLPPDQDDLSEAPGPAYVFFRIWEADVVRAMTERIFPADENGPGAADAGVTTYIDRQLGSVWGMAGRWNMSGPFFPDEAADTQGWQYPLTPRETYRVSIQFIQDYAQREYGNDFQFLEPGQQDEILQALEDGEVDTFRGIAPDDFFTVLLDNTMEGLYSDPVWGGNQGMVGWQMKQYPGSYVSYHDRIGSEEFIELDPQDIASGHGGVPHPH